VPEVDIAGWIKAGWELFVGNIGMAIVLPLLVMGAGLALGLIAYGALVVGVITGASEGHGFNWLPFSMMAGVSGFGCLALALVMPALGAAVLACFLDGIRTGKLSTARLDTGWRNWWACTWVVWVMGAMTLACLAFAAILVGLPALVAVATLSWLALFRIVDRGQGGNEAMSFAWNALRGRLWMMLLFTFLIGLLRSAGVVMLGVGVLITTPIAMGALAAAYNALAMPREAPLSPAPREGATPGAPLEGTPQPAE